MAFFCDAQETARQYEKYITEFQELFRTNDVSFGSPEDFFRLAPMLARDGSFRDGFTALAKSVQQREEGRLALTGMLTIVGVAAGGTGIDQVGDEGTVPVSLLVVFLAGLGGWGEADAGGAAGANAREGNSIKENREQEAAKLEQRLAAGPKEDIGSVTTSLFGGPMQVKEALSRLEMNTLQMKMHLDSIDSRMERIAPQVEEGKARGSEQTEDEKAEPVPTPPMRPWPKPGEEAPRPEWEASAPPMRPWPAEKERDLVWKTGPEEKGAPPRTNWPVHEAEPAWRGPLWQSKLQREEPSAGAPTLANGAARLRWEPEFSAKDEEELPTRVPFHEYLEREEGSRLRRGLAVVLGVIVIALTAAGGWIYRGRGWQGVRDAADSVSIALRSGKAHVAAWMGDHQKSSPAAAPQAARSPAALSGATGPPLTAAPAQATEPVQTAQAKAPVEAMAQEKQPARAVAQHSPARETALPAKNAVRRVVSVLAGSGVGSEGGSPSSLPKGMHSSVPVFVDEARLSVVSGPRPDYPRDALARGIAGDVVVQAIVGRTGEVESAQIVSGPAGLLKPSVDAARQWRFRPYVVEGAPVEVRTYIRFRYAAEE